MVHPRPWSAIFLGVCGVALIVGAGIRVGDIPPIPFRNLRTSDKAWEKDPASLTADYAGWACIALAFWLARPQQKLDDTNDPADDPIARLDESDPVPRPAVREKRNDSC
jgi:hypothetical protein